MKINLGCGSRKLPGWINADRSPACNPDQVVDLETIPWPWPADAAEEILLSHVLEHLGGRPDAYLRIIQELYRICRDGAKIVVVVPHPRHDAFLHDPTHVRAVTVDGLALFSQRLNRQWLQTGLANTPLGIYAGVDFELVSFRQTLDEPWRGRFERGEISEAALNDAVRNYNNVIVETAIELRAVKPPGNSRET